MCMKYINATAACFKLVSMDNNKIIAYNAPFNSIKSVEENNALFIDNFSIITQIDFLGTGNAENKMENPLEMKKTVDFIIRLTKCDALEENRLGRDLDCFSINLAEMYEKKQVDKACFDFFNYTRITNVDKLDLPKGIGKYVIKVLIKLSEDKEYTIQSMTKLIIM